MKRFLACLLTLTMLIASQALAAEGAFTVGSTTKLSGSFFTDMWGSNTSDMDVRALLHGYNLMQWKGGSAEYVVNPSVVRSINMSNGAQGGKTYTLKLHEDLKYSDGTPITAWDYAFTMLLSLAPQTQAIGGAVSRDSYILGAQAYTLGRTDVLSGVRVLDAYSLAVTVQAASVPYYYEMGLLDFSPYPISVIAPGCEVADDGQGVYIRNIDQTLTEPLFTAALLEETILDPQTGYLSHPGVVSGAYTLTSYDAVSGTAEFAANPYYKANAQSNRQRIENIELRHVTGDEMIALLESGELDLINKVTHKDAIDAGMKLASAGKVLARSYDRIGLSFVSFNCEQPAMSSQAVRQAIAHCFDKDAFVQGYVGRYGTRVDGWYGTGQWMYKLASNEQTLVDAEGNTLAKLDGLQTYALSTSAAANLLSRDGWKLNDAGIREKKIDGQIVTLELEMICPQGNEAVALFETTLVKNLDRIGVKLTIREVPFEQLLATYYRQTPRDCDMIYLASNFDLVFDPTHTFELPDANVGLTNRTGIADARLAQLAADLNRTEPGDLFTYLTKWVAMQKQFAQVLPAMPVYSNVYYDFYTKELQGYDIRTNASWADALIDAWLIER